MDDPALVEEVIAALPKPYMLLPLPLGHLLVKTRVVDVVFIKRFGGHHPTARGSLSSVETDFIGEMNIREIPVRMIAVDKSGDVHLCRDLRAYQPINWAGTKLNLARTVLLL